MNVLITSGGTREYIDDVRVLTNISSGMLGKITAERFLRDGHNVFYVHTKTAHKPETKVGDQITFIEADSVMKAHDAMKKLVPNVDIVIHSMAVSDFTFNRDNPVKLKSNDIDGFINYMKQNMVKAPKILPLIKGWNPSVTLVGFKFEVGKTQDELFEIAKNAGLSAKCDFTLANDKKVMQEANTHIAWLMDHRTIANATKECYSKYSIANAIYEATVNG
jgi:phosphopantothenate--cysteine ligase